MKKFLFIASLIAGFFILHSCVDPNSLVNTNSITGPRILSRVDSSGVTQQKYHLTNSKLTGATTFTYDASSPNPTVGTISLIYSGNKISVFEYLSAPPAVNGQNFQYKNVIKLMYDTSGKVTNTILEEYITTPTTGTVPGRRLVGTLTYNSSGKVIKQFQKIGTPAGGIFNYSMYSEDNITYTGENISGVETFWGTLDSAGNPSGTPGMFSKMTAENFDTKINPYTTLPKEFNICWGVIQGFGFIYLNPNNHSKLTYTNYVSGASATTVQNFQYQYDAQNYPTSSNNQDFIYQAL
ncbi:hypothetical protein [Chryseobacterium sp.]|uniref:hypothetical protein n=1 Tax=Chryseobacterium sp. TaxID=1871047 RepID=UPI0011CBF9F2|nr:hypothetical protein [Chryseobacterium sp.]TXF76215.1 hypothetical protein FUA25_10020 [Chryseobacterium sp.]